MFPSPFALSCPYVSSYCHPFLVQILFILHVIYFPLYFHIIIFTISFPCCYFVNYHFYIMLLLSSSCCHLVVTISANKLVLVSGIVHSSYRFCYSIDSVWFTCSLVVIDLPLDIVPLIQCNTCFLLSHDVRPLPQCFNSPSAHLTLIHTCAVKCSVLVLLITLLLPLHKCIV